MPGTILKERLVRHMPGFDYEDDHGKEHVILIDDAQQAYWDSVLWTWLKDACQTGLRAFRAILFCGHEHDTADEPTMLSHISNECKVQLDRESHTPGGPLIGLTDRTETEQGRIRRSIWKA